jgi:hypothetical protein
MANTPDPQWETDYNATYPTPDPQPLDDRYELTSALVSSALNRGYTQQALADRVGVSRRTVHSWLHRKSLPTYEHYRRLRHLVRPPLQVGES